MNPLFHSNKKKLQDILNMLELKEWVQQYYMEKSCPRELKITTNEKVKITKEI